DVHQALVTLRTRVERLEEDRNDDRRMLTEDRDARTKEREAIISHVATLEESIAKANDEVAKTKAEVVEMRAAVNAIVGALDIGTEPAPGEKAPSTALTKLDRRAK